MVVLAFVCVVAPAEAVSFTRDIVTGPRGAGATAFPPNVVSLFLPSSSSTSFKVAPPPIFLGGAAGRWTYSVSPDGKFAQLVSMLPFTSLVSELGWSQRFDQIGPSVQPFQVDFQEVQYNWSTGAIEGVTYRSIGFGMIAGAYGTAGGTLAALGPAPEPATGLVMLLGIGAAALVERRRRRAAT